MKGLILHDDHCRLRLMQNGVLSAGAIGITAFLVNSTGFRERSTVVIALVVALLASGLVSSIELRRRGRLLRRLIDTGVRIPVTLADVEWSDDPESPWGNGVWPYTHRARRFEIYAFESIWTPLRSEATALVDPDQPERAVLVMANGFTRGGYQLTRGSRLRRTAVGLVLLGAWGSWIVAIGFGLSGMSR
ncbi:MAG: hypothetical protein AABM40_01870 [Chloroflexota bacterium]